jgi:hypothetical protein
MGTGSFPGVESGRGVTLTLHPLLVPRYKNRVELYLYSPYGPSWSVKMVKPAYPLISHCTKYFQSEVALEIFSIFSAEKEKYKNITTNFPNKIKCGCKNRLLII